MVAGSGSGSGSGGAGGSGSGSKVVLHTAITSAQGCGFSVHNIL